MKIVSAFVSLAVVAPVVSFAPIVQLSQGPSSSKMREHM